VKRGQALLASCALLLAGCGGASEPETTTATDDANGEGEVILIDAGEEPRQLLAYSLEKGDSARNSMRMKTEQSTISDGVSLGNTGFVMSYDIEATVTDSHSGRQTISFAYEDAHIATPGLTRAREERVAARSGFPGNLPREVVVDEQGRLLNGAHVLSDAARTAPGTTVAQLTPGNVPFPDEEIGLGARWEVVDRIGFDDLRTEQTSTYTLEEITGEVYRLSVEQAGDLSGEIEGSELTGGELNGNGGIVGNLSRPLPVFTKLAGDTSMDFVVPRADGDVDATSVTQTKIVSGANGGEAG